MLEEHIRLGNVCLDTLKEAAKRVGHELLKPVTDAWDKGNHVEAVMRAGLEIGSLLLMIGDLAKLAQVGKVAEAAKLSEAAKAAEAAKVAEAAKAAEAVAVSERVTSAGKTIKEFSTTTWNGVKIKARSMRDLFLGRTPGKGSRTGKDVIERMREKGKIREVEGKTEFQAPDDKWYDLKDADMAHSPKDAVTWWNETGYQYGARSPEARAFMTNPDNYVLDYFGNNRSAGSILGQTTTYRPPIVPPTGL